VLGIPVRVDQEEAELETVGEPELSENRCQMSLDRALADVKAARDLLVARAGPDQVGDLALPRSQQVQALVGLRIRTIFGLASILFQESGNELALRPDLSVMDPVHHPPKKLRLDVLVAVSPGAGLQHPDSLPLVGRRAEQDHLRIRGEAADGRTVADSAGAKQVEIEEKDIGRERRDRSLQAGAVGNVPKRIPPSETSPPSAA